MRVNDRTCTGACYDHGAWTVKVERLPGEHSVVPDECPLCREQRVDAKHLRALEEEYQDGYQAAMDDA